MPGMLHDSPEMPQTTYAPNGARLVSLTGEALPLKGITLTGTAVGGTGQWGAAGGVMGGLLRQPGSSCRLS